MMLKYKLSLVGLVLIVGLCYGQGENQARNREIVDCLKGYNAFFDNKDSSFAHEGFRIGNDLSRISGEDSVEMSLARYRRQLLNKSKGHEITQRFFNEKFEVVESKKKSITIEVDKIVEWKKQSMTFEDGKARIRWTPQPGYQVTYIVIITLGDDLKWRMSSANPLVK